LVASGSASIFTRPVSARLYTVIYSNILKAFSSISPEKQPIPVPVYLVISYFRDTNDVISLHPGTTATSWECKILKQTYGEFAELLATPAYVNNAAYNNFSEGVFLPSLTFNLDNDEGRGYSLRFD